MQSMNTFQAAIRQALSWVGKKLKPVLRDREPSTAARGSAEAFALFTRI